MPKVALSAIVPRDCEDEHKLPEVGLSAIIPCGCDDEFCIGPNLALFAIARQVWNGDVCNVPGKALFAVPGNICDERV